MGLSHIYAIALQILEMDTNAVESAFPIKGPAYS